jgi:hypothetical protein
MKHEASSPFDGETYIVSFQGRSIECSTLEDAINIRIASGVVTEQHSYNFSIDELYRFASVLTRYDQHESARTFSQWASRRRVAKYFADKKVW